MKLLNSKVPRFVQIESLHIIDVNGKTHIRGNDEKRAFAAPVGNKPLSQKLFILPDRRTGDAYMCGDCLNFQSQLSKSVDALHPTGDYRAVMAKPLVI